MRIAETLAFVAVVRAGSFTEAGRRMGVPKSTLSRQVTRLEEHLGARLLQRTTRRLALTATGEAYYARCRHAIEEMEEAERVALDVAGHPKGELRVSAAFDLGRDQLVPLLPAFRARYPEITIQLLLTQGRVDMVAEGIDVALRGGLLEDAGYVARKLASSDVILCASPTYLDSRGRPRRIAELVDHDLVMMGVDARPMEWRLMGPEGREPIPQKPWFVANEWGVLHALLRAGLGIGVMLEPYVQHDLREGRLEQVLPAYAIREGGLYAVYPSRHHLTPKVRVFVDFLAEALGEGLGLVRR